jgi:galactonate dehydratase
MRIARFETLLANAGLRNYLFIRLTTDTGLTGVGEATLEWQERTVQTLCHEWVEGRVLGADPFDIEAVVGGMVRDQYQGGSTVMTAISGVEIALWDLVGKACGQPVYRLLGGRCHAALPAYANGWYGGANEPAQFAEKAREVVRRGYRALKFDPFGTAWKELTGDERKRAIDTVVAVREAVGRDVGLMIEFHGRLSAGCAVDMIRGLENCLGEAGPVWCEEPVAPECVDLLAGVKAAVRSPIATGERLYTLADFHRLTTLRAADVVQMDIAHCGGILAAKKIAAMAAVQDMRVAPHCSIGPVALAAAMHFDVSTPNFMIQESFAEFDVPWRSSLVRGWDPVRNGELILPDAPGLGIELDDQAIADHPYQPNAFPSLWDERWLKKFSG